jgi:predicted phosphate transport protein (TIGR00153 family)
VNLLPKDERFFEYFHQQSDVVCKVAHLLASGLKGGYSGVCDVVKRIEALERSADEIAHAAFEHLRTTFITPFDPEDIQALVSALDDVVDTIEDAAFRIVAYRLDPIPPPAVELGEMVANCCVALGRALQAMHDKRSVMEDCIEVNRIEDEADALERSMLTQLFSSNTDTITVIKLKDIYESLESATDRCEDVADLLQSIAVKNL